MGIESFLGDDLGAKANVISDVHPGAGISESDAWQPIAVKQVAKDHPDITVLSIGANEGFPMEAADGVVHNCCDDAWKATFAARLRRSVDTYLQNGRGRVILMTVQLPRDEQRVPIFAGTNDAVELLQGTPRVDLLRMDQLFTPHGYTETIDYRGKTVDVREPDGIHLNVTGTSIAARVITADVLPYLR
jgi:hypothetical protein